MSHYSLWRWDLKDEHLPLVIIRQPLHDERGPCLFLSLHPTALVLSPFQKNVFDLIHDLAYDHDGIERFQYVARAQKILATRGASVQK